MDKWVEIRRRVLVEGSSKRSVCREFQIQWDTLARVLGHIDPDRPLSVRPLARVATGGAGEWVAYSSKTGASPSTHSTSAGPPESIP